MMVSPLLDFVLRYKYIILFYLIVIILLVINRKKIEVQAKFIFLYRTKWGLQWMDRVATRFREWVILLGYVGVGIGFMGMMLITYLLLKNLYDLLVKPAAIPGVSLVLPGINIPGLGILPFWHWLLAILVIAIVHEFAHGVVARAHGIEVKNTGIVLFGPIIGAFVEPNEKKLRKQSDVTQYSVLAAGAFTNIILALLCGTLLFQAIFLPLQQQTVEPRGFAINAYIPGEKDQGAYPIEKAGVPLGGIITEINDIPITRFEEFAEELQFYRPGDTITITTIKNKAAQDKAAQEEKAYTIVLAESPDRPGKAFLGMQYTNEFEVRKEYQTGIKKHLYYVLTWWTKFLQWLSVLSLGLGLVNLLPLPIVDGGRMLQVFLHRLRGPEKGERQYRKISLFLLLVLILNLVYPFLGKLFT